MAENATVLLVEDESMIAVNTAECLEEEGFCVTAVGSPSEALKVIAESGHELAAAFVDINLNAEMTGFEVAQAARRQCPGLAVLYTSGGHSDSSDNRRVPGGRFIGKPYRHSQVAEILREMIGDRAGASLLAAE